jgi:hypothetical protein
MVQKTGTYNKYQVGDKVVVRQWDDMVAQYGIQRMHDGVEVINIGNQFVDIMKRFCGQL